jgi:signal transduction histidine kinase
VRVTEIFERVYGLMKDQFEQQAVDFDTRVEPQSIEITADPALIEQVLINLCKNAAEAVNHRPRPRIELSAGTDPRGNIIIRVADNGKGIPEEVAEKIFIPFFTTKPDGSGIGLSLSRQIMRLHRGTISVSSPPDAGTVFKLKF